MPEVFEAVDGMKSLPPNIWPNGPGAWGCLKSHQRVLESAVADGVDALLVLEDDVCFTKNFKIKVEQFLRNIPKDWDQLMIGGQHINTFGEPHLVRPGIYRTTDCERRHCFAIRGEFMRKLAKRWEGGGRFNGNAFGDFIMGRDPEMQFAHKVYSPKTFLAGQDRSYSDIYGAIMPRKFWNPPPKNLFVINLHASPQLAQAMQAYGLCYGTGLGRDANLDQQLNVIFAETKRNSAVRLAKISNWIKLVQWELGYDDIFSCAIHHPEADPDLIRKASLWKVFEIRAKSVDEVLAQLPKKIQRMLLDAHRKLSEELKSRNVARVCTN